MGNNFFFTNYECDKCNHFFGEMETSLSMYGGVRNTIAMIKGKKTRFQNTKNGHINIRVTPDLNRKQEDLTSRYDSIKLIENESKLIINFNKQSYIPKHVLKSLVKIGVCLCDNSNIRKYKDTIEWLLTKDDKNIKSPLFTIFQSELKSIHKHPSAILYKKRKEFSADKFPDACLVLFFGLYIIQIFRPLNTNDIWIESSKELHLPVVSQVARKNTYRKVDFSSNNRKVNEENSFSCDFKKS